MSRNPNTEKPQPGEPDPTPIGPDAPVVPDPAQPEPLPLPPDQQPSSPPAPVREPNNPQPAGDPPQGEPPRLM